MLSSKSFPHRPVDPWADLGLDTPVPKPQTALWLFFRPKSGSDPGRESLHSRGRVIASVSLLLRTIFEGAEMAGAFMRKLLLLICVLGISGAARAQSKPTSWENLNTLQADEKIQVVEMDSKKVSGTFVNVTDAALSLQVEASQETIHRQDVRSVKLMKHQHRLRNALIGAAVGFGAGAGIGAAAAHPCSPSRPYCFSTGRGIPAAFGGVIGLAGGAVVGALLPSHKTVYLAK